MCRRHTDGMKRLLLLLPLLLPTTVAAEDVMVGIARLQYPNIQHHFKNYERANDLKDWSMACGELHAAMILVMANFDGLTQLSGDEERWWQFRKVYKPILDDCHAKGYIGDYY